MICHAYNLVGKGAVDETLTGQTWGSVGSMLKGFLPIWAMGDVENKAFQELNLRCGDLDHPVTLADGVHYVRA